MGEIQNPNEGRTYLLQSCWLARARPLEKEYLPVVLRTGLEMLSEGASLLPLGFLSDFWQIAIVPETDGTSGSALASHLFGSESLTRYENHVLGSLYGDRTLERAAETVLRYRGRERERCVAFILTRLAERLSCVGTTVSARAMRSLLELGESEFHALAREAAEEPLHPELAANTDQLIQGVLKTADLLEKEDLWELERGAAQLPYGQRLALRQIVASAAQLEVAVPEFKPESRRGQRRVATRLLDEDRYPVGGFSTLTNRGSIESLLGSQLAFMEADERPDLFDIKFVRDELLYFSRDENEFVRNHRTFIFVLYPELIAARVKDESLPFQRIVLLLGLLCVAVQRLQTWLSDESLRLEFVFPGHSDQLDEQLVEEQSWLEIMFREQIENGSVQVYSAIESLTDHCLQRVATSEVECLVIGGRDREVLVENAQMSKLIIEGPQPETDVETTTSPSNDLDAWRAALAALLISWV